MKKKHAAPRPAISNRKTERKQKRQEKKVKRKQHYVIKKILMKTENNPGRFVKRLSETKENEEPIKKKKQKVQTSIHDILIKERQKDIKETNKLKNQMEEQRQKMLTEANEDEDKIIKKLEKQLGLNKTKNKNNFFSEDGLDYLLEICDRTTTEQIVAAEKHLANVEGESDFEEDLAAVTGKDTKKKKISKNEKNIKKETSPANNESDENSDQVDINDDEVNDEDDDDYSRLYASGDENSINDEESDNMNDEQLSDDDFGLGGDSEELSDDEPEDEKPNKKVAKVDKLVKSKKLSPTIEDDENIVNPFSDDEVSHLSDDGDDDDDIDENDDSEVVKKEDKKEKPEVWEDIYGRKRDKEGNVIKETRGAYVPPALRDAGDSPEQAMLNRQIMSVMNKLAANNLHWASSTLERVFASHSRHAAAAALCRPWLAACAHPAPQPARLLADLAALLACLHANVAAELGAHFLQQCCATLHALLGAPPAADKRLDNLLATLGYMYNFQIFNSELLYDILARLLSSLGEARVSAALAALRVAAAALRRAAPAALAAFVHATQARAQSAVADAAEGSRIKFLLEVLLAIKNNNLTKVPGYEPEYSEQMRRLIRTVVRKGNCVTTLNIRLEDLLNADERGKWWIVGSAWSGGVAGGAEGAADPRPGAAGAAGVTGGAGTPAADARLLELARQMRMNTDVRRAIFCCIMSAEDYADAHAKLTRLAARGGEREVAAVLLACCLRERSFNPYYALLARRLIEGDRKYLLSLQYSIWDRVRELASAPRAAAAHLARLVTHLVLDAALPLTVLKVIEFSDLNKSAVRFMRQILLAVIMNDDFQVSLQVFQRISRTPKLHMFRESLRLFIQHFLVKNAGRKTAVLSDKEMDELRRRTLEVDRILTMHESKLQF